MCLPAFVTNDQSKRAESLPHPSRRDSLEWTQSTGCWQWESERRGFTFDVSRDLLTFDLMYDTRWSLELCLSLKIKLHLLL